MKVELVITNEAAPILAQLIANLDDPTVIHRAMASRTERLIRDYLRKISKERHRTAQNLGARPTGALERAAESPEGHGDRNTASVTIKPAHLFARVFGDVTISPQDGRKYLTIPVHPLAYGRRAREFADLIFLRVGPRKTAVLARRAANGGLITYYVLVRGVRQKQDRTLLPSDGAILDEMEAAAGDVLLATEKETTGGTP